MSNLNHFTYNFSGILEKNYHEYISIGPNCASAIILKSVNLRTESYPFDWALQSTVSFNNSLIECIMDDFKYFLTELPNIVNKYNIGIHHLPNDISIAISMYERKISRFKSILNSSKKILFVYAEEPYLYDKSYRENSENLFKKIYDFNLFLFNNYPNLKHDILFIGFDKINIELPENFKYVTLETTLSLQDEISSPYSGLLWNEFRIYGPELFSQIFNCNFSIYPLSNFD